MRYFQRARCFQQNEILSSVYVVVSSFIAVVVKQLRSFKTFRILDVNFITDYNLQVNGMNTTEESSFSWIVD